MHMLIGLIMVNVTTFVIVLKISTKLCYSTLNLFQQHHLSLILIYGLVPIIIDVVDEKSE
jgi:hypothetical protein